MSLVKFFESARFSAAQLTAPHVSAEAMHAGAVPFRSVYLTGKLTVPERFTRARATVAQNRRHKTVRPSRSDRLS